ncbi:MAG: invasion associated locus B family protein [Vicinamibacterales bacterium]|nr:invasion associated locus B family protein [Vicinamibacterales bacterium]
MRRVISVAAWLMTAATAFAQAPPTLPGGATQLQETHGDWRVVCTLQNNQRRCGMLQQQADKDSHQLVVAIELRAVTAGKAEGTIVLPFGLAVDRSVGLQIDDSPGVALPFRTCLAVGCLVMVTFEGSALGALGKGAVLTVTTTPGDGVQAAAFKISLNGFASAFARTAELSK